MSLVSPGYVGMVSAYQGIDERHELERKTTPWEPERVGGQRKPLKGRKRSKQNRVLVKPAVTMEPASQVNAEKHKQLLDIPGTTERLGGETRLLAFLAKPENSQGIGTHIKTFYNVK